MTNTDRIRLIFHGTIVLIFGLLSGLPTVIEVADGGGRYWHTAHEALIMVAVWFYAEAAIQPSLVLDAREATALRWAMMMLGYGFTTALVLAGIAGAEAFAPGTTPLTFTAFVAALIGILGAFLTAGITLLGARAALKGS